MSLRYVVALDMCSGALEDMTLCLIWPMVVYVISHVSQCVHSLAFLIFLFPFKLFFLLLLRSPPSKQSLSHLCPFALLQCLSQYKDHMRQQSREPKDIRERAVRVTSSLDGLINVHETHLHCYPLPQEPTHSQTPSGSSLNKLQMGEEVRVHMYMQHLDSSCTICVYPPYTA